MYNAIIYFKSGMSWLIISSVECSVVEMKNNYLFTCIYMEWNIFTCTCELKKSMSRNAVTHLHTYLPLSMIMHAQLNSKAESSTTRHHGASGWQSHISAIGPENAACTYRPENSLRTCRPENATCTCLPENSACTC